MPHGLGRGLAHPGNNVASGLRFRIVTRLLQTEGSPSRTPSRVKLPPPCWRHLPTLSVYSDEHTEHQSLPHDAFGAPALSPRMFNLFRRKHHKDKDNGKGRSTSTDRDADHVARELAKLSFDSSKRPSADSDHFVGGFVPPVNNDPRAPVWHGRPGESPRPPPTDAAAQHPPGPLPTPPTERYAPPPPNGAMSRTMQHAMRMPLPQSNHYPDTPQPRPSATGPLRRPHSDSKPYSHPAPSATQAQPPATPSRPQPRPPPGSAPPKSTASKPSPSPLKVPTTARPRANSNPTSPVSAVAPTPPPAAEAKVRCSGMTKAGKQCNRMVVTRPPLGSVHPDVDVELERFCHQHVKELLKPPQFPTKAGTWIDFEDWIPKYLHPLTQANLRVEMQKPLSAADECGFIYCFEIRDPDDDNRVYLKVGRTVVLNRRIDQWSKQCGSKEQYLRYWYPGPANEDDRVVMKGLVQQGDPGPWCHRLERLIHLELADLSLNAPYLDPQFPNIEAKLQDAKTAEKEKCPDCGKMHKEIFTFPKATHGIYVGREWEMLVKPVIEKWGRFVTDHLKKD